VWSDTRGRGEIWAPEIVHDGGRYYIYFSAGAGAAHRMFVITSASPAGGYTCKTQLALPDGKWAIDGTMFTFNAQRWFVWSGWAGDTNVEQNLYIARMSSPTTITGGRSIISQPREGWERVVGNPFINEGPEAIRDPTGSCTSSTPPTAAGATSTASPTCGCAPAGSRRTSGTGTSRTGACSARTGPP